MRQPSKQIIAQDIDTAPKDGTVIWVTNGSMDHWVLAKYGTYEAPWGQSYPDQWVVVEDPDWILPVRSGSLVTPKIWKPNE